MSFAEIAEFHQKKIDREHKVMQFKSSVSLACTVWGQMAELSRIAHQSISLLPDGSKAQKDMVTLAQFYATVASRMDGIQAPNELNVFTRHNELASELKVVPGPF